MFGILSVHFKISISFDKNMRLCKTSIKISLTKYSYLTQIVPKMHSTEKKLKNYKSGAI